MKIRPVADEFFFPCRRTDRQTQKPTVAFR